MNVVYCVTANYIDKIKPSIRSLRDYNPDAKIYLVTEADSCDIKDVEVIDIRGQKWFPENGVNYHNPYTYIGLLKTVYTELLPCDKVLHMDADTIVNGSLNALDEIDMEGKWYAMCEEKYGHYRPFGEKYYNAGVFLLNLKQMREDRISERMVEYLNTVPQPFCEQDAFVKYGIEEDKIIELDSKWNESCVTGYVEKPKIVHFCAIKDWWNNTQMPRAELLYLYR